MSVNEIQTRVIAYGRTRTCRPVVADSEIVGTSWSTLETAFAGAIYRVATDLLRGLPHCLGEEAPAVEIGHRWCRLSVVAIIGRYLWVVESISDDLADCGAGNTGNHALTVTSALARPDEY